MRITIELETVPRPEMAAAFGRLLVAAAEVEKVPGLLSNLQDSAPSVQIDEVSPEWPLGDPQVVDDVSPAVRDINPVTWSPAGEDPAPPPPGSDIPPPPQDNSAVAPKQRPSRTGQIWSSELHSSPPAENKDGTWRKKRGTGTAKAVTATTVVTLKEVQLALGKLHRGGVDVAAIDEPMTQAIAADMTLTTGGMKMLIGSTGDKLAEGCRRAMGALQAVALAHGVEL